MTKDSKLTVQEWIDKYPILEKIHKLEPVFWQNPDHLPYEEAMSRVDVTGEDVKDAEERLKRFAPFIAKKFPETAIDNGLIESPITEIEAIRQKLESYYDVKIPGKMYLKRDDLLPIAGTIKARGAIYEVLKHAETLALEAGLLTDIEQNYEVFTSDAFCEFFREHTIVVGTTGNLGISVGVMGAALGFNVTVHMSADAKEWKKSLLRSRGVEVVEHQTNFTEAVTRGRQEAEADPKAYFVDDEHSMDLFFGYTTAASRLKKQLDEAGVIVDADHPLIVYSPCGIGGSPGGVAFGLKQIFGDNVYCLFAEPTQMPSMLLGLVTGEFSGISVYDLDIPAKTNMDGLAVPRTSGVVSEIMQYFFDGGFTLREQEASDFLKYMIDLESIKLEPAALAGVPGPARLVGTEVGQAFLTDKGLTDQLKQATHLAWATGGSMVPGHDMEVFYQQGQ